MATSSPNQAFSNAGQEQERGQRPVFTLTRHPGSSEVELRAGGDEDPFSLPLVSRGGFTLYDRWLTYNLRAVPPAIAFLLSSDPPSPDVRLGATDHGSLSFDHGKAEETITVTYRWSWLPTIEVTMTWLHLFALLPGYHPVVKLLLAQGADHKAVTSPLHQTPLHLAATRETATVLINNEAEVNVRDEEGRTALHLATRRGDHSTVQVLLSNGADPNIPDSRKQTALLLASEYGHHSIAKFLLDHEADLNIPDSREQTPLHLASECGHHSLAEVLLSHGADPNIRDYDKRTPLHLAILRDHHSIVHLLLDHGADVLATDLKGRTPLSLAKTEKVILAMIGHEAAKRLIEKGARLDVKNRRGETALDSALANGHRRIASLLPGYLQSPLSSTGRFEGEFEVVKDEKHKDGVLGVGATGWVLKARRRGTDDVFAIKEIPFPPEDAEKTLREVRAAMELSRECRDILTHHDAWLEDRRTSEEDESSESSSPSEEESDDGIRFEETEETGRSNRSQDAISFNEGGSHQDNQRRLPRGSEEESDEPPSRSSAQGDGSESDISLSTRAAKEQYLKTCTFTLYIQMDLMEMTLKDYIKERNEGYLEKKSSALSWEDRRTAWGIFWELCNAVRFVHKRGFIHRDLKPSNVLLSPNENPGYDEGPYSARLSDFGLSTRLVDEFGAGMYKTVGCGTPSYAAPEQLKGGPGSTPKGAKYGEGVDVYSLALIAVELRVPMSISERFRVFEGLRSPEVRIPKEVEESLDQRRLELVRRGLSHEPTERPTAGDLRGLLY
ncbi:unnamed protein product [Cyprideis torosa]|uniref:Uncharacterized protein n=1 Tax=Cyprideis torosa TaxID=163714 RepID=A0A7R8ZQS8_9CRUS|nr:unnamed protein product [Cyprideis torosa]CAG0903674.1 unnamed protein product [Cyprideis torosa]